MAEDAAAIAAIYNDGIADRIAMVETEPRTAEQIVERRLGKGDRFRTIVAEHDGQIAYVERGFWKIVSRIFPENTASLARHERCGSRVVGVYTRHGKLDGEWRDGVIVERPLDEDARAWTR